MNKIKNVSELYKVMTDDQKKEASDMFNKYYKKYIGDEQKIDDEKENDITDNNDYLKEVDLILFDD